MDHYDISDGFCFIERSLVVVMEHIQEDMGDFALQQVKPRFRSQLSEVMDYFVEVKHAVVKFLQIRKDLVQERIHKS